jgi:thymidylate synthase (FAD)
LKIVEPEVRLIARPTLDWEALKGYLESAGVNAAYGSDASWYGSRYWKSGDGEGDAEVLVEVGGKVCYRSWEPGLNPNVTKVREDRGAYLRNLVASGHGSVLEHAHFTFALHNVSRVMTAELNRHRAGVAISEQSMRYVRLDKVPFWFPEWAKQDQVLLDACVSELIRQESFQVWLAGHFGLDETGVPFHEKKAKTSFMRRFAPMGVATEEVWTANVRTLRHVIELRTDPSAEEEIRIVFGKVAEIMKEECPQLFDDFVLCTDGAWRPTWRKV